MKKYLLIISCVWVSMSVAANDMSSDVRAGDGQVTVTQRASTVDAQGQAVDANETSANANSSSVGGTNNSRNDYSMVKPAVNTTLTPNTSIINGWGCRNHTPIKPGDEECDGTKLMGNAGGRSGILPTDIGPGVGIPKPKPGKGTKTVAGTYRNNSSVQTSGPDDNGNDLMNFSVTGLSGRFKSPGIVSQHKGYSSGGQSEGIREDTPIQPFRPRPTPPSVDNSKGSIEKVTSMIDNLLTNGSSEGVSIEDVTSMIDTLLTE
jgi:hypothetical protein